MSNSRNISKVSPQQPQNNETNKNQQDIYNQNQSYQKSLETRNNNSPQISTLPTTNIQPQSFGKKALIIANTYKGHESLQKLPNCELDARGMKNILEKKIISSY